MYVSGKILNVCNVRLAMPEHESSGRGASEEPPMFQGCFQFLHEIHGAKGA